MDWGEVFTQLGYWYGWDFWTVAKMPLAAIGMYMDRVGQMRAQEELMLIEAVNMPYLDKDDRHKVIDRLRSASDMVKNEVIQVTPEILSMLGISMRMTKNEKVL